MNLFETEFERNQRILKKKTAKGLIILLIFIVVVLTSLFLVKGNFINFFLSCWGK